MNDRLRVACIGFAAVFIVWTDVVVVRRYLVSFAFSGDWTVLWTAGRAAHPYADMASLPFAYPPTALLPLKVVSLLPFATSLVLWSALGTLALGAAAVRLVGPRATAAAVVMPAWVVAAISGQFSLFAGALAIAGVLARRPWLGGLCFAIAGTLKPQALVVLPIALVAAQDWRRIVWTAAWAVGVVALTLVLWGPGPWLAWADALPQFRGVLAGMGLDRVGVGANALAIRFGMPAFYWVGALVGVVTAWAAFRQPDPVWRYAGLICGSALLSPYMLHYDLAAVGAVAAALLFDRERDPLVWAGASLAVSFVLAPWGVILLALAICAKALRGALDRVGHAEDVIAGHGRGHAFRGLGAGS